MRLSTSKKIEQGGVYIAPGHSHLRVAKQGHYYVCKLDRGKLINRHRHRHRPSVEALFDSVTDVYHLNTMGVLLTGTGADGAEALLRMREAKMLTVAQDEKSSFVWGMPCAAVKLGAAINVLDLNDIVAAILFEAFQ
ncbi:MAG: two-component system chemotaxis response regulator CheB [Lentisphaeria bacterium]|jgi:two-component system chemotaxis response regulator CheB